MAFPANTLMVRGDSHQRSSNSEPPSPLPGFRRAPPPSLSLASLGHFQAPNSTVSSPGSFFLTPPINTTPFMSPPPHQEGLDYMNSKPQRATRKKHHTRNSGSTKHHDTLESRFMPARSLVCSPAPMNDVGGLNDAIFTSAPEPSENYFITKAEHEIIPASEASQDAKEKGDKNLPAKKSPQGVNPQDFTVVETVGGQNIRLVACDESFRTRVENRCTTQDLSVGADRSLDATVFSQNLSQENPKASIMVTSAKGLALPATISLRRATRIFQSSAKDDEPALLPTDTAVSTSCKLFAFTSEQHRRETALDTPNPGVFYSTGPSNGNDLMTRRNGQRKLPFPTNCSQRSLAEPAITITSVLPSPAVLVTPTLARKSASRMTEPERRFSVVQVKSRGSVTEVIWQEDESSTNSSYSGHSSRGVSPIDCAPRSGNASGSPQQWSSPQSIVNARDDSESIVCDGQGPSPHAHMLENDDLIPQSRPKPRLQDAMLHWSWGGESGNAPILQESETQPGRPSLGTSYAQSPVLPQLLIPEDDSTQAPCDGRSIDRRGSSVDLASLGNIGAQREVGSRRSISVHSFPQMLCDDMATETLASAIPKRRMSRIG